MISKYETWNNWIKYIQIWKIEVENNIDLRPQHNLFTTILCKILAIQGERNTSTCTKTFIHQTYLGLRNPKIKNLKIEITTIQESKESKWTLQKFMNKSQKFKDI